MLSTVTTGQYRPANLSQSCTRLILNKPNISALLSSQKGTNVYLHFEDDGDILWGRFDDMFFNTWTYLLCVSNNANVQMIFKTYISGLSH